MNVLNNIYSEIFYLFSIEWNQKKNVTFMNFNTEFELFIEKNMFKICKDAFTVYLEKQENNKFY